jgi:hypothetical protein
LFFQDEADIQQQKPEPILVESEDRPEVRSILKQTRDSVLSQSEEKKQSFAAILTKKVNQSIAIDFYLENGHSTANFVNGYIEIICLAVASSLANK